MTIKNITVFRHLSPNSQAFKNAQRQLQSLSTLFEVVDLVPDETARKDDDGPSMIKINSAE